MVLMVVFVVVVVFIMVVFVMVVFVVLVFVGMSIYRLHYLNYQPLKKDMAPLF